MVNLEYIEEYNKVKNEYFQELYKLKPEKGLKNIKGFIIKALWAWDNINPKLHISFGNAKLPKTTCIINLGTWFNCSGRKEGFCELCKVCYDKQPEVRFKRRTRDRLEQEIFWRSLDAKTFSEEVIKKILEHDKKTKTKLIRWSEVGEIRNQKDLEKIIECSNIIYETLDIKSYIYTHNKSLNFNIERPNLIINGSNFMVDNEYKVIEKDLIEDEICKSLYNLANSYECLCDCTQCETCSQNNGYVIYEELR